MAAKPIVDRIEQDHRGNLVVIRINVQERSARPLLELYNFQFTPTFILFDGAGQELLRSVGAIDPRQIDAALTSTP